MQYVNKPRNSLIQRTTSKMLGFVRRCKAATFINSVAVTHHPTSNLIKFISSDATLASFDDKGDTFTKSYLINSCGVAPDAAKRALKILNLKSASKPDAVLECLRIHGFSDTQIANLVGKCPLVLVARPEKTITPKLQLFASLGATPADVAKIFLSCHTILHRSLDNKLAPLLLCLKTLFHTDKDVVEALLRFPSLLRCNVELTLLPNIAVLRDIGMPENIIYQCLKLKMMTLCQSTARFKTIVEQVNEMGFDPKKYTFAVAVTAFVQNSQEKWEQKRKVFLRWGWSETEFLSAFRKGPYIITFSEKKIDEVMKLMVGTMGFSPSSVAGVLWIFTWSMKRLLLRRSILQFLETKGIIKRTDYEISVFGIPDAQFLKKFVTKHEHILPDPESLNVYCKALKTDKASQVCQPA